MNQDEIRESIQLLQKIQNIIGKKLKPRELLILGKLRTNLKYIDIIGDK